MRAHLLRNDFSRNFSSIRSGPYTLVSQMVPKDSGVYGSQQTLLKVQEFSEHRFLRFCYKMYCQMGCDLMEFVLI